MSDSIRPQGALRDPAYKATLWFMSEREALDYMDDPRLPHPPHGWSLDAAPAEETGPRTHVEYDAAGYPHTVKDGFRLARTPAEETGQAKRATRICMACDGCGWVEGGKTLKTPCTACGGTGEE